MPLPVLLMILTTLPVTPAPLGILVLPVVLALAILVLPVTLVTLMIPTIHPVHLALSVRLIGAVVALAEAARLVAGKVFITSHF